MERRDYKEVYIGELIRQKLDERCMSYAEFARRIHCGRTTLYKLFASKSIDVERLLLISEVLQYDFIHEIYLHSPVASQVATLFDDMPCVVLPLKDGRVSMDGLPETLRKQIKEAL